MAPASGGDSGEGDSSYITGRDLLDADTGPATPPEQRVADALQNAKAAYDDGNYQASHRYAEVAERLDREHLDGENAALALSIQAFALLQLGLLEDYQPAGVTGFQRGALSKFQESIELEPASFRTRLGLGLARFRRHGISIDKAEKLAEATLLLSAIEAEVQHIRGQDDRLDKTRVEEAERLFGNFSFGRSRLLELNQIFTDPAAQPLDANGRRKPAPWLGSLPEKEEELAARDIEWILSDAVKTGEFPDADEKRVLEALGEIRKSWSNVRYYWRLAALKDLQFARDTFLDLRKEAQPYFWLDRDLAFVYESLGAFFLDLALEKARLRAIAEGAHAAEIETRANEIFLDKSFRPDSKQTSRDNYEAALTYIESFVQRHERYERERLDKAESADFDDLEENPFLVDLVARYRTEMTEAVREERNMRRTMLLEAAALVIDPVYQINSLSKARIYASKLKAMSPRDPTHYFVLGTAYFENELYESALAEYETYMRASSITEDAAQRKICRQRIQDCKRLMTPAAPSDQ